MVRPDFIIKEGQKVGIVVYNRYSVTTSSQVFQRRDFKSDDSINTEKLKTQFGPAGSIAVYCGEISYVGTYHIEYGLNSFNGCSGAVVFLLDVPEQHFSVQEDDRGKAIAVHGGYHPTIGTNVGFKFAELD